MFGGGVSKFVKKGWSRHVPGLGERRIFMQSRRVPFRQEEYRQHSRDGRDKHKHGRGVDVCRV